MTDAQKKFFELANKYEAQKAEMKQTKEELQKVMTELGFNTYHQDPSTGLVYLVEVPKGTFVSFDPISYKRTKKEGESGGTVLAKSEAESKGFILPGKSK